MLKTFLFIFILLLPVWSLTQPGIQQSDTDQYLLGTISSPPHITIKGWNILTDWKSEALGTLDAIDKYDINHLQLSHHIIMDLKDVRDTSRRNLANLLIDRAHQKGIEEVVVWDHALYNLDYYPDKFRTGPGRTLDLDNQEFWNWLSEDYRQMLGLLPNVDGIVLTFIETGARAEEQYSSQLLSPAEKLAAVVNAVAKVVIEEAGKSLYIRTFAYNNQEYQNLTKCIELIDSDQIVLMMKESPHDFFLSHPNSELIGKIDRPTIVEFDCGNEFNGQSMIANTWPEHIKRRWKDYIQRPNVIGYVARTDRYRNARAVGTPNEILLYALDAFTLDTSLTSQNIYESFIIEKYGKKALPYLLPAFQMAFEIVTSTFYTLGLNSANHSRLDFEYPSIYIRHVSGRWTKDKHVFINHNVNRKFHYFKDIVNHLSPAHYKVADFGHNQEEIPNVFDNNWLVNEELMNETYLQYIVTEKEYGLSLADSALRLVMKAEPMINPKDFPALKHCFERTMLTSQLRVASAKVYYARRIWDRGESWKSPFVVRTLEAGKKEIQSSLQAIQNYKGPKPEGQWIWESDIERAESLLEM